jgi:diketogulonate reductase-like aldo/keto reductase
MGAPSLRLAPSGTNMPQIGFGMWGVRPRDVDGSLRSAVRAGYRLFDMAPVYNNEQAAGETLAALAAENVVQRHELFLTSKVPPADACDRARLLSTVRRTLRDLQTSYLDLYLVHWPFCVRNDSPTWPPYLRRGSNRCKAVLIGSCHRAVAWAGRSHTSWGTPLLSSLPHGQ